MVISKTQISKLHLFLGISVRSKMGSVLLAISLLNQSFMLMKQTCLKYAINLIFSFICRKFRFIANN